MWDINAKASSAADLQEAASAMLRENGGVGSALTHRIARAGTSGRHRQNIARDINRALNLPVVARLVGISIQV